MAPTFVHDEVVDLLRTLRLPTCAAPTPDSPVGVGEPLGDRVLIDDRTGDPVLPLPGND